MVDDLVDVSFISLITAIGAIILAHPVATLIVSVAMLILGLLFLITFMYLLLFGGLGIFLIYVDSKIKPEKPYLSYLGIVLIVIGLVMQFAPVSFYPVFYAILACGALFVTLKYILPDVKMQYNALASVILGIVVFFMMAYGVAFTTYSVAGTVHVRTESLAEAIHNALLSIHLTRW